MEQVLTVYHRPYDPLFPVVNMDEQPIQLISHSRAPLPMRPGDTAKIDYEYVREGMCNAFLFVQPLGGWREVHVSKTKTAVDWAGYVKWLVNVGVRQPQYASDRLALRDVPRGGSVQIDEQAGACVHSQARQLVEYGGAGVECDDASMFQ